MRNKTRSNNIISFTAPKERARSSRWLFVLSASLTFSLLAGAVYSTASVARLSYLSAQYQNEELQLLQQQQSLEEKLTQAQALDLPITYAKQEGFSKQPASNIAVLDLSPDLASNVSPH